MQLLRAIETERLNIERRLRTTEEQLQLTKNSLLSIETRSSSLEARLSERERMLELALERLTQQREQLAELEMRLSARDGSYEHLKQSFDDYSAASRRTILRQRIAITAEAVTIVALLYVMIRLAIKK